MQADFESKSYPSDNLMKNNKFSFASAFHSVFASWLGIWSCVHFLFRSRIKYGAELCMFLGSAISYVLQSA